MTTPFRRIATSIWAGLSSDKDCERSSRVIRYPLVARARLSSLVGLPPSSYGAIKTARHAAGSSASVSGGPGLAGCNDGAGCKAVFENQ